jgi:hypothetical protein
MPSLNTGNAILSNAIAVNSSYNVGIGGAASGSLKLQVTGSDILVNGLTIGEGAGSIGSNTVVGASALPVNTTGTLNTAIGNSALLTNTTGYGNTSVGYSAIGYNTTGFFNAGVGVNALLSNTTGTYNNALGTAALYANTTGSYNTAVGQQAGTANTTGSNNTYIGYSSGLNITTGSNNTIIGNFAGTSALANNIVLADGAGNVRYQWDGTNNVFTGAATFSSSVTASGPGAFTAVSNGSPTLTLGTAGAVNAVINSADEMFFNIDSNNDQGGASFIFGTNRTGTSGGSELVRFSDNGISTFSNSVVLTNGALSVDAFGNAATNYITLRAGYAPDSGGGIGFKGVDHSGSSNDGLGCYGHDGISFYSAQVERMRITSNGNVGIGTTPNATATGYRALQLATVGNWWGGAVGASQDWYLSNNSYYDGAGLKAIITGPATEYAQVAGVHTWSTASSVSAGAAQTMTERMRITSGGTVLINQTSLSAAGAGGKMQIATDVLSTGSVAGYFWENRSGGVTSNSNWYGWYTTGGTIFLYNGSANAASINPSTGAYTALNPSDIRIKDNVRNYDKGLNELLKINVKEWEYNGKAGTFKGEKGVGFVANELEQAIPEWVGEFETYLEKDDKEKTKLKNINVNELPYLMIKAIQELNQKGQEQQAQIEELKQIVATK